MQEQRSLIPTAFPLDSIVIRPEGHHEKTPVYLLLHGYGQRAKRTYREWAPLFSKEDCLVIPNGPFPLPRKNTDPQTGEQYYQIPRAWYFYNNLKDEFLIDYSFPAELLAGLIQELGLLKNPLCLIGYSQGGYLAPFVGVKLKQTKHVVGVNCRFREDMLPDWLNFRLDAFHADQDTQVDYHRSQKSFHTLNARSLSGEFITWEGKDHGLDDETHESMKKHINTYRELLV